MRSFRLLFLLGLLLTTACSVKLVPQPTATAKVNSADNSISETHDQVTVTARLDELSLAPYQLIENLTAFHVAIENRSSAPVELPLEAFVLKDADDRLYRPISPERAVEIISRDTVYLIPYPYVGYYYLEDQMQLYHFDTFSSSLPFYAEYHPQDIFTLALPRGPIPPDAKIAGRIYFVVNLEQTSALELMIFDPAQPPREPTYLLPFAVEK